MPSLHARREPTDTAELGVDDVKNRRGSGRWDAACFSRNSLDCHRPAPAHHSYAEEFSFATSFGAPPDGAAMSRLNRRAMTLHGSILRSAAGQKARARR